MQKAVHVLKFPQVGPELLVLGEHSRQKGFSVSLLERLEKLYKKAGGKALRYMVKLVTNYRCHEDIVSLSEKLFYEPPLRSTVPEHSIHPDAPHSLVFVCSNLQTPEPCESPINDTEAKIIIEEMSKYTSNWPKDSWGAKVDPSQICIMSPSRTQVRVNYLLTVSRYLFNCTLCQKHWLLLWIILRSMLLKSGFLTRI